MSCDCKKTQPAVLRDWALSHWRRVGNQIEIHEPGKEPVRLTVLEWTGEIEPGPYEVRFTPDVNGVQLTQGVRAYIDRHSSDSGWHVVGSLAVPGRYRCRIVREPLNSGPLCEYGGTK